MNISKQEQRALHVLAQGGAVLLTRDTTRKIIQADCVNRDGWHLTGFNVDLFKRLKKRRLISSRNSRPYRISSLGLSVVRSQMNNR
ncbi:UPF0386 protein [Kordiimonas sediminis]|uniref:UPF0386 protein GCM10017044_13900 n=1 Tax=Kordiimonas sediminis TaxID=1735581 RepID=A0A919E735_9PROT|nr:YjhX family toxin [Kordiimonas sediminis]GHF20289.1 UPF0386 protein [Kordiimonas sediminis]